MPDLEERFRSLARTSAPDLWPDAVSREPRTMPIGPSPGRRLAIAALAFVVAVAGVGLAVWAFRRGPEHRRTPVGPAIINGRIAYASNGDLWTIEPDGTDARRLTSDLPGSASQPSWSPDGTRLVFVIESHQDSQPASIDSFDLYEIGADGSGLTRLTTDGGDLQPSWSPDGTKIAYSHDGTGPQVGTQDIWVMNADGSDPVALTHERSQALALSPSWSPDGRKILFVSNRTGTPQIYVMNADGTDQTQLTEDRVFHANPQYSPEGTQIAFAGSDIEGPGIYLMNTDGTGTQQLTHDAQDGPLTLSWAPDATKIVYTTSPQANQNIVMYVLDPATKALTQIGPKAGQVAGLAWQPVPLPASPTSASPAGIAPSPSSLASTAEGPPVSNGRIAYAGGPYGGAQIITMEPNGTQRTAITSGGNQEGSSAHPYPAYEPAWSPDGSRIAFRGFWGQGEESDLFVVNADGSGVQQLTTNGAEQPSWSPDGTKIAFGSVDGIYMIDADGTGLRRLTPESGLWHDHPSWSPDGGRIAYVTPIDGTFQIFSIATDGTDERQLTDLPEGAISPSWSPDGSKIAFVRLDPSGGSDIYVMNLDGTGMAPVTACAHPDCKDDFDPAWSPDGANLLFVREGDIYSVAPDGSDLTNITNDRAGYESPSWQPIALDEESSSPSAS